MMLLVALFILAHLSLLVGGTRPWSSCLSAADAQSIIDRSAIVLSHTEVVLANETAQGLFADNIIEYGDSINALRGVPLGPPVGSGKQPYIAEVLATPPIPTITTLDIVRGCSQLVWQWQFDGIGSDANRVRGFALITVDGAGLIVEQHIEFNSLAWVVDLGFTVTPPSAVAGA